MSSAEPLVVLAGRVIDVETGDVRTDQAIVLEGDRIREVVPAADAPGQARTIDLSDRTVDRKSTRLNSSHVQPSRMPSSA